MASLKGWPAYPACDAAYVAVMDAILSGQSGDGLALVATSAYFYDLHIGQFSFWRFFPSQCGGAMAGSPAFSRGVLHVVAVGSNEQMQRIAAEGVVAGVADLHACGDSTERDLVGHTVSQHFLAVHCVTSVSVRVAAVGAESRSSPHNATARLLGKKRLERSAGSHRRDLHVS